MKRLSRIEGRDISEMVLLDDNVLNLEANPRNSIPINSFGSFLGYDNELEDFKELLAYIFESDDVREFIDYIKRLDIS